MFIDGGMRPAYAGPMYGEPQQRSGGSGFWGSLLKGAAIATGVGFAARMFMPFGGFGYNPFMYGCGMPWGMGGFGLGSMLFNPMMSFGTGALMTSMLCGGRGFW